MDDIEALWIRCAEALREQVSEATWQTWLSGVTSLSLSDGTLVLGVPNSLVRDRIETRFLGLIKETLAGALGREIGIRLEILPSGPTGGDGRPLQGVGDRGTWDPPQAVTSTSSADFLVADREPAGDPVSSPAGTIPGPGPAPDQPAPAHRRGSPSEMPVFDPRYTFDTFVTGSSNRFAHAATLSVAEAPAKSYNPLFIHGEAGLGKTHLLQAIGNYVLDNFPDHRVRYVSTETFMNEFVDAIRSGTTTVFKRRYRECDVLLIDDVQFMEGKESLQEEFFHTFNSLYGAAKQIVLTSDRPPKSIATLEDRLRSRFLSGLITDIQPPELETRLAILRSKAEREEVAVPYEVLDLIATHVKDNIRELEGALIRVTAFGSLYRQPLTRELAERVLADIVTANQPRRITPQVILEATAGTFGFTVEELQSPNRRRPLVTARQISMYVFRELTDYSYPAIAREFGGRDHTTVIHAVEKIAALMKERHQIYNQVTELILRIKNGE